MTSQDTTLHIYIISDSIGETALNVVRATIAQFPNVNSVLHKFTFVSTSTRLQPILDQAYKDQAILYLTIADPELAKATEKFCQNRNLTYFNLMQPMVDAIYNKTGHTPSQIVGAQHELSDEYFSRINAMEFTIKYDDGKDPKGFQEADIILLGISRTSKTPLSMYLSTLGFKVANLPLISENEPPQILFEIDRKKIVGLTNDLNVVQKFRNNRMIEYGLSANTQYASSERITKELQFADTLYKKLGVPVLNVAERSIEESAHIIINILNYNIK